MRICPYCACGNREGVLFCEECGQPFVGTDEALEITQMVPEEPGGYEDRLAWGTARFTATSSIMFRVRDFPEPVTLLGQDQILLGRSEPGSDGELGLDLSLYDAAEQGVSRRHAAIRRAEDSLMLLDLNSTNGTFLNGQRLPPQQPRVLRDGDEIRLGRLVMRVFFR